MPKHPHVATTYGPTSAPCHGAIVSISPGILQMKEVNILADSFIYSFVRETCRKTPLRNDRPAAIRSAPATATDAFAARF
jgi:hypothetical protein